MGLIIVLLQIAKRRKYSASERERALMMKFRLEPCWTSLSISSTSALKVSKPETSYDVRTDTIRQMHQSESEQQIMTCCGGDANAVMSARRPR
jgi:hypothetical protein